MRIRLMIVCQLFCLLIMPIHAQVVDVTGGRISGQIKDGVALFKGIPYAAPPVDELRWKPTKPVVPWQGIKKCDTFSSIAPQPPSPIRGTSKQPQSEDCLYINVWTTSKPGASGKYVSNKPVMVWIHGGGMTIGSGSQSTYDGTQFAKSGVVLVTFNYRLGALGFMSHPELSKESPEGVSGNYGLLDQIAALKWVRDNIKQFGGDPGNVTIFGESAGAVSVACHLVSPLSKGLFHRAILQSGTAMSISNHLNTDDDHRTSLKQGLRIESKLASGKGIQGLRKVNPENFISDLKANIGPASGKDGFSFGPVIDGYVLPDAPGKLMHQGKFNKVPILIGANADEMTMFMKHVNIKRKRGYDFVLKRVITDHGHLARINRGFQVKEGDDYSGKFKELAGVMSFIMPSIMLADRASTHGSEVWFYYFSRVSPRARQLGIGATHGIEIPYIFATPSLLINADRDRALSQTMHQSWISFAQNGKPHTQGTEQWQVYDSTNEKYLEFGQDTQELKTGLYAPLKQVLFEMIQERWDDQ